VLEVIAGRGASVEIYGAGYPTPDGAVVRYYIRAEGLCRAPVVEQEGAAEKGKRRIYRLGNGNGFLVNHVIEATREVTGCKIEATEASRRAGDPDVLVGSSRKGQKSAARWPLSHGVRDAWNWGWPPRL
jgi:UDP-glucose 4-epimerase